jgi:hypothetical protein
VVSRTACANNHDPILFALPWEAIDCPVVGQTSEELAKIPCRTAPLLSNARVRSRLSKCHLFSGRFQSRARKQAVSSNSASPSSVCGGLQTALPRAMGNLGQADFRGTCKSTMGTAPLFAHARVRSRLSKRHPFSGVPSEPRAQANGFFECTPMPLSFPTNADLHNWWGRRPRLLPAPPAGS